MEHVQTLKKGCRLSTFKCERREVRDMKKGRKMRPYSKFCDFLGESPYSDCRKGIRTADNRVQPVADANAESRRTGVDSLIIKKQGRKMRPYSRFGDSVGNRTPVAAVRGLSLNRWTTEPKHYYIIIRVLFCLLFFILLKKIY